MADLGRSEAHTTFDDSGDVNFGGGGRMHDLTVLGLAALATLALLVALAMQVRR